MYNRTNDKSWSEIIRHRRFKWVGHLLRLPEETPVKIAYREANRINKANKRNNCNTWRKMVNEDLKTINKEFSLDSADFESLAEDREWWYSKVVSEALARVDKRRIGCSSGS